ncbi:MAG: YceD family protein, partial [Anaerolineales bacterium]
SQSAGYGREFDFQEPKLSVGGDIMVEEFTGRMRLTRTPQGIVAKGSFSAKIPAECARCLQPFASPINIQLEDLFIYPPQNATDPLLAVAEDAHLNLEPLLREYILINQPTRLLCREDCKGLCPVCGNDLNEGPCDHPEEQPSGMVRELLIAESGGRKGKTSAEKPSAPRQKAAGKKAPEESPRKTGKQAAVKPNAAAKKKTTAKPSRKGGKQTTAKKKVAAKKKTAAKTPRKKTSGGKKTSSGGKSSAGGKKKSSKKK